MWATELQLHGSELRLHVAAMQCDLHKYHTNAYGRLIGL